jgi:hypothetical protein
LAASYGENTRIVETSFKIAVSWYFVIVIIFVKSVTLFKLFKKKRNLLFKNYILENKFYKINIEKVEKHLEVFEPVTKKRSWKSSADQK